MAIDPELIIELSEEVTRVRVARDLAIQRVSDLREEERAAVDRLNVALGQGEERGEPSTDPAQEPSTPAADDGFETTELPPIEDLARRSRERGGLKEVALIICKAHAHEALSPSEVAALGGIEQGQLDALRTALWRLGRDEDLDRPTPGYYQWPKEQTKAAE